MTSESRSQEDAQLPETLPLRRLALSRFHKDRDARLGEVRGVLQPMDYGDPEGELTAAQQGSGLVDVSDMGRLELVGEDRVRFLSGLVTCDITSLTAGQGCYGFFTTPKGRILADVVVLVLEDRLWLELPQGSGSEIKEHLRKYIVADRVDVRSITDVLPLRVLGRGASWAAELNETLPSDAWAHARCSVGGTDFHVSRFPLSGADGLTLWVSSGIADAVLVDLLASADTRLVGHAAAETLRIRAGIPRFGFDFGTENLPQETRIDAAVNYEKGCYLGQEIVARLHYRGQPAREIRRLSGEGEIPRSGSECTHGDQVVARLSSTASREGSGWCGLAMVRRAGLEAETLRLPSGETLQLGGPPQPAVV